MNALSQPSGRGLGDCEYDPDCSDGVVGKLEDQCTALPNSATPCVYNVGDEAPDDVDGDETTTTGV